MTVIAKADLNRLTSRYRSDAEEWWATFGPALLEGEFSCAVVVTEYEPATLHLLGEDYTPDFYHVLADGREVWVEIKAPLAAYDRKTGKRLAFRGRRGMQDARSKLRAAAQKFPYWHFLEVRKFLDGNLELEHMKADAP
jgi:hypothetical protein